MFNTVQRSDALMALKDMLTYTVHMFVLRCFSPTVINVQSINHDARHSQMFL